ncbi:5,6-dimethylbenzimidazole synthase [Streptomyces bungoensis]|uniref:Nicotinate-nucleotide--dimethylbenzimidazole phosphoribosyltransferase n=1 Tax=Streptomyces bungoensis TaxID=285568 RepID=A0A101T343_9ACTN|nr:nicotinate-nucleotide--dimethylbenzimidazole phosphoribosyltransferase [Streptomyces bungoensis]KUN84831.1 5,6-dimethylbenzimidazole synthase [Streptomyces bungoensis]
MTDTGQVPGEGLPESAGMVEQPGVPAHGAYTYLSEAPAEDEDLLLPGAQGAWGNEVPPPAPEPVVEAVHEPGPHETAGRDSGSVDLSGVRLPNPAPASAASPTVLSAPHDQAGAPQPPRRPLHLGPPIPDTSASPVRSLADRGPAGAPVRQPAAPAAAPEYLDVQALREAAPQSAAPWGAAPAAVAQAAPEVPAAETVGPPAGAPGAAQAAVARLTAQAGVVHGHDGVQPAHGHDGVYGTPAEQVAEAQGAADGGFSEPAQVQAPTGDDTAAGAVAAQDAEAEVSGTAAEPVGAQSGAGEGQGPAEAAGAVAAEPEAAEAEAAEVGAPATAASLPDTADLPADAAPQGTPAAGPAPVPAQTPDFADFAQAPQPVAPTSADDTRAGVPVAEMLEQAPGADAVAVDGAPVPAPEATDAVVPVEDAVLAEGGSLAVAAAPEATDAVAPVEGASLAAASVAAADGVVPAEADSPAPASDAAAANDATDAPHADAPPAEVAPMEAVPAPAPGVPDAPAPVEAGPAASALDVPEAPGAVDPALGGPPAPAPEAPQAAAPAAEGDAPVPDAAEHMTPADVTPVAVDAPGNIPDDAIAAPEPAVPQAQGPQIAGVPAPQGVASDPEQHAQPQAPDTPGQAVPAAAPVPEPFPAAPAADAGTPAPAAEQPVPEPPAPADPAVQAVPEQPGPVVPEQPLGQFVPVDGQVPTTPHLAPTPAHPLVMPAQEPAVTVPAPRGEAEPAALVDTQDAPDVVQQAEDLETRAADQEESTAAVEEVRQSAGPAAPPYDDAEREAVLKVMRERRDIRNGFRADPIPHEVLLRVLEAAHTAPSVGHSQPWDFVVIRSADTRRAMHELAMRQREAYAKSLPKGRAKQFKELKIEAILDTPVNIVVTADPTRGGRHTLGRHTQPQMAPYSAALAVENLWLAARAEGLGVGWVSFFDEREMVRALGLPEHLEVIAYLCVGYVDEFPDEPELMQAGWSKRRPLSWVVHEETYGRRALPGEEPHDLLAETVAQIRPLDAKALGEAWERQKRMTKPAGALGMLEIISAQLSGLSRQCPPPIPEPAAVAIFAGDHGVHAQGVTPWPQEVTAQMVANFLGGGAVCNAFASQVGAEVCVVDVGVAADLPATPGLLPRKIRGGTSDMTAGPAMTREEAKAAIEVGIETARDLVAAGNKALLTGEMGIANTTASAALISVFTGADPAEVTGRGTGINDETLARKTEVVRRALELHQPDPADPIGVLAALGGFEHAAMVGLLLGGASLRTPVILDGVSAGAAALVARAIAPEVLAACIAGHRSAEPGHVAALNKLGLRPLVDLDLRLGEGTGALLALPLVQSTARAMHEVATFDSAGVTEK